MIQDHCGHLVNFLGFVELNKESILTWYSDTTFKEVESRRREIFIYVSKENIQMNSDQKFCVQTYSLTRINIKKNHIIIFTVKHSRFLLDRFNDVSPFKIYPNLFNFYFVRWLQEPFKDLVSDEMVTLVESVKETYNGRRGVLSHCVNVNNQQMKITGSKVIPNTPHSFPRGLTHQT